MRADYDIIRYHLPKLGAQHYAEQALRILADLESAAFVTLPTFLSANSVLTLSGVRAFDAYHEFYDYIDEHQASLAMKTLEAHGIYMEYGDRLDPGKSSSRLFELLNETAFQQLWDTYEFPSGVANKEVSLYFPYDTLHTAAWIEAIDSLLAKAMSDNILPRAWLDDQYAPLNIRFGMMLGYPAKAIESLLWEAIGRQSHESINANIAHHEAYFAAWPVYSFAKSLEKDKEIVTHQKLWSEILDYVYTSPWHTSLQNKTSFLTVLKDLKRYEERHK